MRRNPAAALWVSLPDAKAAVEQVFRQDYGRIIATLIRIAGSFDRAEEALQDAFAAALAHWEAEGVPTNGAAWITTAARRKLIDRSRRERTQREKQAPLLHETATHTDPEEFEPEAADMDETDDRLRLIFTCCHPAIGTDAQVALTLRTLCGLTTVEIARAFLLPEPTLAQRLVRAKRKISDARIPYTVPRREALPSRLAAVQSVIYLIFNEGYEATAGSDLIRVEMCAEAIRLARLLCELMPGEAENGGLLALLLLTDARRPARTRHGKLVRLDEQDRTQWVREEIAEGLAILERALRTGRSGQYQLQAAVAALHAEALTADRTDWRQIAALYGELLVRSPSPVLALNRAAAIAMSEGLEIGLALMDEAGAGGNLDEYFPFHAARADLLRRLGRRAEALMAYRRALALTQNAVEQDYIREMIEGGLEQNDQK